MPPQQCQSRWIQSHILNRSNHSTHCMMYHESWQPFDVYLPGWWVFIRHWLYCQTIVHDTLKHRPGQLQVQQTSKTYTTTNLCNQLLTIGYSCTTAIVVLQLACYCDIIVIFAIIIWQENGIFKGLRLTYLSQFLQ